MTEPRILLAIVVIVVAARATGSFIRRFGHPRVQGEILAGILLGPSLLGALWPGAMHYVFTPGVVSNLHVLAHVGLTLFMFTVGLDLDIGLLKSIGRKAGIISQISILAPLITGSLLGLWLYPKFGHGIDRLAFCVFIGVAMSITAFPVLARVLAETGLTDTRIGVLSISSAAIDDVMAWCLLAAVAAITQSTGWTGVASTLAFTALYGAVMLWIVHPLLKRRDTSKLWFVIAFALANAWLTETIGIHAIFGAFVAGAVLPRENLDRADLHRRIDGPVSAMLLPIFFAVTGLSTRIDQLGTTRLWGVVIVVTIVAIVGKGVGSALAAKLLGETNRDSAIIGLLLNTRGLTEIVMLSAGRELGIIGDQLFAIMVVMALITTFMTTPIVRRMVPNS